MKITLPDLLGTSARLIMSQQVHRSIQDMDVPVLFSVLDRGGSLLDVNHFAAVVDHRFHPADFLAELQNPVVQFDFAAEITVWTDQLQVEGNAPAYAQPGAGYAVLVDASPSEMQNRPTAK